MKRIIFKPILNETVLFIQTAAQINEALTERENSSTRAGQTIPLPYPLDRNIYGFGG